MSLCACTKTETAAPENDQEINFQVTNYLNQTKANVAFTGDSFGVYAWYDSEASDGQNQIFMENETVKPSGTDWKVDGKTFFWPKTGDVDFFAYAPTADEPWITCDDANNKVIAPATTIAGTEDYMYSSMAMNYSNNVNPATYQTVSGVEAGVPILFHHALAKLTVNFAASVLEKSGNIWTITVNKAEFVKVCTKGSLEMDMDETPTTGVVGWTLPDPAIWTPSTVESDNIDLQAVPAAGKVLTTTMAAGTLNEYSVLPQDLAGMNFHINFTIKASNDGGKTWYSTEVIDRTYPVIDTVDPEDETKTIAGAFTAAGNNWLMNTKYVYNVTISPNSTDEVLFDPAVVDWAPEVTANYTINN